jgi:hypothetical protein
MIDNLCVMQELFEARIKALEDKVTMQFQLTQLAVNKAELQMNARLEGMNEFRASINDRTANYPTRTELNLMVDKLNIELQSLQNSRSEMTGKASEKSVQKVNALAILGLIAGVGSVIIRFLMGH